MLSIVIPVYNYNILPLVERLHQEASSLAIPFEILVCDDASTEVFQNQTITQFSYTRFLQNQVNQHIAYTRNRLLKEAQYPWILLLDADVFPLSLSFIQTYLQQQHGLFFQGGFTYPATEETSEQSLRLKYGREIEQHKHLHSCCNLFFNQSELQLKFDDSITTYGYEDTLFFLQLNKRDVKVKRVKNPVLHYSTESNATYLVRTQEACITLAQLIDNQTIQKDEVQLGHVYTQLKKYKLTPIITGIDLVLGRWIKRNLLGKYPSLLPFKLYKLIAFHKASQGIQKK